MGEFIREQLPDPVSYFEAEGHTLVGPKSAKWKTTDCYQCGGSDPMRVHVASGAYVCMAGCGAKGGDVLAHFIAKHGTDFVSAAKLLGAWRDDGKPDKPHRPKPLPASQAIQVLAFESTLTAVAAGNIAHGIQLTDTDRARLYVAAQRIQAILGVFA